MAAPARLFFRPEPVEAMALLPNNRPAHFTWRGSRSQVRQADGSQQSFGYGCYATMRCGR